MLKYLKHVEMQPDRMGNHTNVNGVAVFRIAFNKQGRVDCAETVRKPKRNSPLYITDGTNPQRLSHLAFRRPSRCPIRPLSSAGSLQVAGRSVPDTSRIFLVPPSSADAPSSRTK